MKKVFSYLLIFYLIILPLVPNSIHGKDYSVVTQGLLFLVIFVFIIHFVINNKNKPEVIFGIITDKLIWTMGLLFIVMITSSLINNYIVIGIKESLRFATYIALYIMIKFGDINYKDILKALSFTLIIVLFLGIIQFFTGIGASVWLTGYSSFRIESTLDNPNTLGAYLILMLFPLITLMFNNNNKRKKIFYILLVICTLVCIVLTMSRNALLGIIIGFALLTFMYSWRYVFIVVPIAVIAMLNPSVLNRIKDIGDVSQNNSRFNIWKMAIEMIKKHPIRGIGNGAFIEEYKNYKDNYPVLVKENVVSYPTHNSYLKIQAELGVFGSISFIAMIIISLKSIIMVKKNISDSFIISISKGFLISYIVFLFMNLSDNLFFVPKVTTYIWVMLGLFANIIYNKGRGAF